MRASSLSIGGAALLCCIVSILIYLNTLDCDLVYDDTAAIRKNMDIRPSASWMNLLYNDFWGTPMSDSASHKSYRPLTVATFRLNYMLHELQPLGYHLVNVLLHSAVCYLYVLLCGVVFSEVWPALIAGLLFAVHPIHTEAVAGVVGRAELLSGLFFTTSLLSHIKSTQKGDAAPSLPWRVFGMACAVCALLSKEQGVTSVGVWVVWDVVSFAKGSTVVRLLLATETRQSRQKLVRRIMWMIMFGVVVMAMRLIWGQGSPSSTAFHKYLNPARELPTPYRQLSWAYLTFVNSWLLLNPINLCADWRFGAVPLINSLIDPNNILTLLTLSCIVYCGLFAVSGSRRCHKVAVLALSLLVLPYLPASNLFFPVGFVVAERVLYLPSMGFCMLVAFGAHKTLKKTEKISQYLHKISMLALVLLLVSSSAKTLLRNRDWKSGYTIHASGVRENPTSGVMLSNLGIEFAIDERYDVAEKLYRASMGVAPSYARGFFNFGKLMKIEERFGDAEWGFRRAVTLGERDLGNGKQLGEAYYHLVDIVSANPRRLQEALEICERAIRHVKGFGHLYIACSNLLVLANRTQDALPVTKMAANSNPKSSVAHYNLGLVHMKLGHLSEAAVAFRTALSIQQDSVQVMYNLASILQVTANGRQDTLYEALELWMRLLHASPQHTEALVNLASLYYELNDIPSTRHTLLTILQHSPNHTDTHYRLGVLDYMQGNYQQALENFSRVSLVAPGYKKTQDYMALTERELSQRS